MPANLTPQYYEAERKLREARSVPERIAALREMLAIMPKHKGTDHLQADLRGKMARLLEEVERPPTGPKRAINPFNIRKEGAGQAALIGLANAGKSALLASFTGAPAKAAPYSFTTKAPAVGMLPYQNVYIQVVDTPALNDPDIQTALYGLLRNAEILLVVVDLSDDPVARAREVLEKLETWGLRVQGQGEAGPEDAPILEKRAILVGSKGDLPGGLDGFQALSAAYGERFPVLLTSAQEEFGAEELAEEVYGALDVIRVYTKAPGRVVDFSTPLVLPRGSTVQDVAEDVHKELLQRFKFGVLWGSSGKFEGQRVGRDHEVAEGDVVELHG